MGYRPYIECVDHPDVETYYGTKLYGYVWDCIELPSAKYLVEIGAIDNDPDIFEYDCLPEIELTEEQFAKWIKLYYTDVMNYSEYPVGEFTKNYWKMLSELSGNKNVGWI